MDVGRNPILDRVFGHVHDQAVYFMYCVQHRWLKEEKILDVIGDKKTRQNGSVICHLIQYTTSKYGGMCDMSLSGTYYFIVWWYV